MWKEWLYPYNPFNSMKSLAHRDRIKRAVNWTNEGGELLPPITLTVDPTNLCNVNCSWCKYGEYREESRVSIPDSKLLELPKFIKSWGVPAIVLSGGEPLMHPKIVEFIKELGELKIQIGLKTNGVLLSKNPIRQAVIKHVKWVGISLDAATAMTYLRVKRAGVQAFKTVLENVRWLSKNRDKEKLHITLKYLIHHSTYQEEYAFCDIAKTAGADDVFIRPVYIPRYRFTRGVKKTAEFYLRGARNAFEDDEFHIFASIHKVEREWDRAIRFSRCYATPLGGVIAANGKFYICNDRRGEEGVDLGNWYPFDKFLKVWGSETHRKLVDRIVPKGCPKCGMSIINELAERTIIKDEMELDFV